MMPMLREIMLAAGASLAASIVVKITVVTALGLIAVWFARGNRAAVRHALLAATFGVMLLLPIAAVLMPPLHVGVPVELERRAPMVPPVIGVDTTASLTKVGAGARVTAGAPRKWKLSLENLLFVGWVAGVALFLLPVVAGLWQIRALRRSGSPWRHAQALVKPLAHDAAIRRGVEVLLHEALPGPMTCGLVRPAIVLPRDAQNWNAEDLNRAITHELEHVRRADSLSCCLARVTCAVYWFHPLDRYTWRNENFVLVAWLLCGGPQPDRIHELAQIVNYALVQPIELRAPLP
jgi:beta-lactamase regulating signal transducer with metallopeptidase domain